MAFSKNLKKSKRENNFAIEKSKKKLYNYNQPQPESDILCFALDSNIINNLMAYSNKDTRKAFKEENNPAYYYSIALLDEIIVEDMMKGRDSKLRLFYPGYVMRELLDANYWAERLDDGSVEKTFLKSLPNAVRKYDLQDITLMDRNLFPFKFVLSLLTGTHVYEQYTPIFQEKDRFDAKILATCAIKNMKLITQNAVHFIGNEGCIRKEIVKRFKECNNYAKKQFGIEIKDCCPITIAEFIRDNYPEKYTKFKLYLQAENYPKQTIKGDEGRVE